MNERENAMIAIRHGKPGWVPNYFTACRYFLHPAVRERYDSPGTGNDWFGVSWTFEPLAGAPTPSPGMKRLTDITKWRGANLFPDFETIDWEAAVNQEMLANIRKDILVCLLFPFGIFERMHTLMGFEDTLCNMYEEPEAFLELANAIADYKIALFEKLYPLYKPDLVEYMDDWGNETGLFFSPDLFRKFIRPATQRIIDAVKSKGVIFELHSDGKVESLVPDMVEMGCDIWNPCQVMNDLRGLKDKYQSVLTFNCGMDNQGVLDNFNAIEGEIRAEVRRTIDELSSGGSFMLYPSLVNQRVKAIVYDEIEKYGIL